MTRPRKKKAHGKGTRERMRDVFAAAALQGLLASFDQGPSFSDGPTAYKHYAAVSYGYADAMLDERDKRTTR